MAQPLFFARLLPSTIALKFAGSRKKTPYFLGDLLDLWCGVEKWSDALLISPIVGKILLLLLWLWLLLFQTPKKCFETQDALLRISWAPEFFLVEKDAEFSAAQLKGSMIS